MTKPDLDNKENIKIFVEDFYEKVLQDDILAHIFIEVAEINIEEHFLKIRSYWEKMLLKDPAYKRHMMNIHREVYAKFPFSKAEFDQWVKLFVETVEATYHGPMADRAIKLANTIAYNMDTVLNKRTDQQTRLPA
jgi:hemoglobin